MKKNILVLLVFLFSVSSICAQNFQTKGTVKDQNGAFLAGTTVSLTCDSGKKQTTVTNSNGEFSLSADGKDCTLAVLQAGFAPSEQKLTSSNQTLEIILQINQTRVSVTAETGRVEAKENIPQAVTLIGQEQIAQRGNTVLAQVADEEVGVAFQRTSPTMGEIFVRGLTGKNVSVYVDGVRFTNSAQRGGVSTFFNTNDPSNLQSVEILRGANSAQYGSDSLGGTVNLVTRAPNFSDKNEFHGDWNTGFASADLSFGSSANLTFGNNKFGGTLNMSGRRVNTLRTADGRDSHAAVTRFLGLPSSVLGERLPDTAFTQYGGAIRLNYSPRPDSQVILKYQRNQQDGGKRYDQLMGGDGNLIANLRNLMTDFSYLRFVKQGFGFFDAASFTVSYNTQREERVNQGGQGNPLGTITHQYERTSTPGFSFFLDKQLPMRNSFLIGGDYYYDRVNAPAYTFNPANNTFFASRPRVPDEARFATGGLFIQDGWEVIPERLRLSGALRYNVSQYKTRAADSPAVNGFRLWGDDSHRAADFSGRIGAVAKVVKGVNLAFNYTRGFRYPNTTDLGTLGLTGDGFETDYISAQRLGGTIGTTAGTTAVTTGIPVAKQTSEYSNTYDFGFRYTNKRFDTDLTVFYLQLKNTITKQALILPSGAVGKFLGDQQITSQNANGAVFVSLATNPVLVRANFTNANLYGIEYEFETRLTDKLELRGNYTFIHAEDSVTGAPPNIEGGTPPPQGVLSLRYEPNSRFWIEPFVIFADRQDRLSSLDLSDRRTGAIRSRAQIQNFFRRGACVYGLTNNPDGKCGTNDETILLATGESILQVQNRVLGVGNDNVPLFTYLPGFALTNIRGGIRVNENSSIFWSFENILDQFNRKPSWGIDGAGRSFKVQYRWRF